MVRGLRKRVTIGEHGSVRIDASELPAGRTAEVIVVMDEADSPAPALYSLLGKLKGNFASAQEADTFLREERDAWER